jgi:hypothetical protein
MRVKKRLIASTEARKPEQTSKTTLLARALTRRNR